jgi:hypothetical protein
METMTLAAQVAAVATVLLAMLGQTVGVIVWIVRLTTRLDTTIGNLASVNALTELAGRVNSLERDVANDKQGRAAVVALQREVAVLASGVSRIEQQMGELRQDLRALRKGGAP